MRPGCMMSSRRDLVEKRSECASNIGRSGIAVVNKHSVARYQFLAATNKPAVHAEWPDRDDAPVSHKPEEIGVVSGSGNTENPRHVPTAHRTGEVDPTRLSAGDRLAAGASAIIPNDSAESPRSSNPRHAR